MKNTPAVSPFSPTFRGEVPDRVSGRIPVLVPDETKPYTAFVRRKTLKKFLLNHPGARVLGKVVK